MASPMSVQITPNTLTDLTIIIETSEFTEVRTLADCTVGSRITFSLAVPEYSGCSVKLFSTGYKPTMIQPSGVSNLVELTPTTDYTNLSDGTNTYYVKDEYSRQFENALLDMIQEKADKSEIPSVPTNYVTTDTTQDITAIKTLNGVDLKYKRGSSDLTTEATSVESFVGPRFVDKNGVQGGLLQYRRLATGVSETNIQTRALSTNSFSKLAIYQNPDGTAYTEAPTPATSDNSTKIATTAYVKAQGYATTRYVDGMVGTARYATSTTAAATVEKVVSIPEITSLEVGQCIIVQPTITSTVANSTIKLNDFTAYPMRYNNADITTSTDSIVWNSAYPTVWMFDGTYWIFITHGIDSNTTYSAMSVAEGIAGTATNNRVMRADYLAQILEGKGYIGSDDLATVDVVTEYSLGTKGYIKFSNDYIIQWGTTTSASSNTAITLPTPFATTNYSVTITSINDAGIYQRTVSNNTPKTTTGFTTYAGGGAASANFSWQAMGK